MTNQRHSKVRLVKCPRCAKILPEPEQIPLYTCGGCGIILQAKYYKRDDDGGNNDIGHVPRDGETSSSNPTPSSADEPSIDQNRFMDQNEAEFSSSVKIESSTFDSTNQKVNVGEDNVVLKNEDSDHLEDRNSPETIVIDDNNYHETKRPVAVAVVYENGNVIKDSHEILLADEIDSGDLKKSMVDDKDQHDDVEELRTQLESINVSETPLSNDNSQIVYVDSAESVESSSRTTRCSSISTTPRAIDRTTAEDLGSTEIVKEPQFESNSDDEVAETAGRRTVSFNDSLVYGPHNVSLNRRPDRLDSNMLKMGPTSSTRQSLVYERRASSVDSYDNRNMEQQEHFHKGTLPEIDESSEWSGIPTRRSYRSWRTRNQPKNPSQVLFDEKLKSSLSEEEKTPEKNRIPRRRIPHNVPRYWSSEMAYKTGSSSSYIHDDIFTHRMRYPPYHYQDSEPRLRKWYSQKGDMDQNKRPESSWMENVFPPMYHSYETSGEFHHRSVRRSYVDRRRRTESWSQIGSLPPKAYSGELLNGRYLNPEAYMHRWSAQLPQYMPVSSSRQGYGAPRETMWDPHDSYRASLLLEESALYPRAYDNAIRRSHIREKQKGAKRFSRPMAGGAPFVACHFCFRVLQLPEEFLYSRRSKGRNHQIKCGNCLTILEFSLEKVSCLAPVKTNGVSSTCDEASSSVPSEQMRVTLQMPAKKKSPLHSLMGYSSPHDVINDKEIKDSIDSSTIAKRACMYDKMSAKLQS